MLKGMQRLGKRVDSRKPITVDVLKRIILILQHVWNFVVWIIGSSLVAKASSHSQIRTLGNDLGLHKLGYKLMWAGMSGMSVYNVVPIVENLIHCCGLPDAVLLHCGGNDIGLVNCGKLLFDIKFMLDIVVRMVNGGNNIFFQAFYPG
ncbi:Hypothetical predicted protein [Mytilus galloprovincialis]|uniref:SGNH hydrolase-type esterase domain-containing protein n=1 Tax=Mytilus galloprovincialis TaxID=29158 RepID=A0A8B6E6G7_MYTGA|nr:Hypothetical predicted protein [Mytilus galloprovincialis]